MMIIPNWKSVTVEKKCWCCLRQNPDFNILQLIFFVFIFEVKTSLGAPYTVYSPGQ
jgi:hypothetical protein